MLSDRRRRVLESIIAEFIDSANPVGSKALIQKYDIPYSSATVRNEMMQLEELGLLEKTHKSSGRIPSEAGYKFYIETLLELQKHMQASIVSSSDKDESVEALERLVSICYNNSISFDEKIHEIIRLISEMTGYTVFYLGPSLESTKISSLRVVKLSSTESLVLLITDTGKIETRIIPTMTLQAYDALDNLIKYLDERLSGVSLALLPERLKDEVKPLLEANGVLYDDVYHELAKFFQSFIGSGTYFSGQVNIITEESLEDFETLKRKFAFFEDEQAMQWFKGSVPGLTVHIGEDIQNDLFDEHAVVRLTFEMPTQGYGTIGVIGPKRMQYNDVIQLLTFISQYIS